MIRRDFFKRSVAGVAALPFVAGAQLSEDGETAPAPGSLALVELTLSELQNGMKTGRYSALTITRGYLSRIPEIDRSGPALNAVIELNPDAEKIARQLDEERTAGNIRGPLHGIPVIIKDNIDTADRMMTTAGSLALVGHHAARDSSVAQKLREGGAIVLGKSNLSEWANFRGMRSTSGWSGRGGQTKNPYALNRNPSGSSSGSAVAVSACLCSVAIGTETDGSILSPSSLCGIVGIKPTVGLISRSGIIPISASQDTAGPMARTVADAALLLGLLAGSDERDQATEKADELRAADYTRFLDPDGLRGARIGVCRQFLGNHAGVDELMRYSLAALEARGAVLVDPVKVSTLGEIGGYEGTVLLYEFKEGLDRYLAKVEADLPVHNLSELIAFNEKNANHELQHFGQEHLVAANAIGPLTDPRYLEARDRAKQLAGEQGIDAVMSEHKLDALVAPTAGPAHVTDYVHGDRSLWGSTSLAAVAGYPSITVPAGQVKGLPVGISFFGRAWSEPTLIRLAYAFEQATGHRRTPGFLPSANQGR